MEPRRASWKAQNQAAQVIAIACCHGLQCPPECPSRTASGPPSDDRRAAALTQTDISKQRRHLKAPTAKENRCRNQGDVPICQVTPSATSRNGLINTTVILPLSSLVPPARPSSYSPGGRGVPEVNLLRTHSLLNLAAQRAETKWDPEHEACHVGLFAKKKKKSPRSRVGETQRAMRSLLH